VAGGRFCPAVSLLCQIKTNIAENYDKKIRAKYRCTASYARLLVHGLLVAKGRRLEALNTHAIDDADVRQLSERLVVVHVVSDNEQVRYTETDIV
jgi:hypothetical protein